MDATPLEALPEDETEDVADVPATAEIAPASAKHSRLPGTKVGRAIARIAARWVGLKSLRQVSRRVPDDCSGLVRLAYERGGLDPMGVDGLHGDNAVTTMWRRAFRLKALKRSGPRPGDLIFFRDTWDRNGDGQRNDGLTHVATVEKVDRDGTVTFIHRSGQGVNRMRMNLHHRHQRTLAGRTINDYLRRPDGTGGPRLTGELFAGYASVNAFARQTPRQARHGTQSR
ncbi:MAG: C40 family peptidase [Myxococcaceae bacterium]|nr:C40 family peptidase [Myxococcaceae bacterium]